MSEFLSKNTADGFILKKEDGQILNGIDNDIKRVIKDKFVKEFTEKINNLSKKMDLYINDKDNDYFVDYEHNKIRYYYEQLGAEDFLDAFIEIYKNNKNVRNLFKSFTVYSIENWSKIVPVDEVLKFLLKIMEYDSLEIKEPVKEHLLSGIDSLYIQNRTSIFNSILVSGSFCNSKIYHESIRMLCSRYKEFNFDIFESFINDFIDILTPVTRKGCIYSDVKELLVFFRNLIGEFIVVSKEPSLKHILKFLEISQIEDSIIKENDECRYFNGFTNGGYPGPYYQNRSLLYMESKEGKVTSYLKNNWHIRNLGGLTYLDANMPCLTLFGQNVFYRIKESLEKLSIEEKKKIINSKWWIDNGYREPAGNVLSNEIKKYYIEPAIYGTPVPVDNRIKDILNINANNIQKAFDNTSDTSYTYAISVLAKLPLISLEAGNDEDKEIIFNLIEIVYNHFGDNEKRYDEFLIFNQKYLENNINLIAWLERCKKFNQIKEKKQISNNLVLSKKLTPLRNTGNK